MRAVLHEIKDLRAGSSARISCKLQKGDFAKIAIFSKEGDSEFSPYVSDDLSSILTLGDKPLILSPIRAALSGKNKAIEFNITPYCDMDLRVIHEYESSSDEALIKVKVKLNDGIFKKVRWFIRNLGRWRKKDRG